MSQVKPPIGTEAVFGDLGSSKTGKEAALDGDMTVVTLATIEAIEGVPVIQPLFR